MAAPPRKPTAIQKLERSQLSPKTIQRELMGDDLDLSTLLIYLKSKVKFDSIDRVVDITVERTIEGASTVVVKLNDHDRSILRSGLLNNRLDIQLDGLWFRLVKVGKNGDILDLTFEDREIAILRNYNKLKLVHRTHATRAEFIVNLLREVKEFKIPYVIPELHKVQAILKVKDASNVDYQALLDKSGGIPKDINQRTETNRGALDQVEARGLNPGSTLTVKDAVADSTQISNANIIIQVGVSMGARRKVLVSAIMTAITESVLRNVPYGDTAGPDSRGLFQQRASWGSETDRLDPATSARLYYIPAMKFDKTDPTGSYGGLCQAVQGSAKPKEYDKHRTEAERFVTAYGITGGDGETSANSANNSGSADGEAATYIYYRGTPSNNKKTWKKENSWTCFQRLADEVQWRAFFVSGVFYFISEDSLIKSLPIATFTESSEGIEAIDGDYDQGKKAATVSVTARVGTWLVPPGAVVVLQDMGPWNGRWLVSTFSRSLFDSKASITLKKKLPQLPEPIKNDINDLNPTWASDGQVPVDNTYSYTGSYINPLPTPMGDNSEFAAADAEGAPDSAGIRHHAGKDWYAPGGTLVVAPVAGTLVEVKQSVGDSGQIFGGVVKVQQDNGYVWVFRHVAPRAPLKLGARVKQGQGIATVVKWADNPGSSHAHIEIWRTLKGGYIYENMIDPVKFITGEAA